MGLDMYLEKKSKGENKNEFDEIMYWRKANQIRNWFDKHLENGVENCQHTLVSKDNLELLVRDCNVVIQDNSKASSLLPTASGFFFGGTDYDDYYYEDIENTIESVNKIINETDWDNEEVYYYEWW